MVRKFLIMCMFLVIANTQLIFASSSVGASLSVHTENEENKPVKGVEVELYKNDKLVSSGVSNDSGDVRFENLDKGNYEIEITSLPEGYQDFNSKFYITITNDKQNYKLEEELIKANYGIVRFHQTNDAGSPISGSEIIIYDKDGNVVDTLVTDENGDAESKPLQEGTYYVEEANGEIYMIYVGEGIQKFEYIINPEFEDESNSEDPRSQTSVSTTGIDDIDEEIYQHDSIGVSNKNEQPQMNGNSSDKGVLLDSKGEEILPTSTRNKNEIDESTTWRFSVYSWIVSMLIIILLTVFLIGIKKNNNEERKNERY